MKDHWNNYCKLSIVHFMIFPEIFLGEGPMLETVTRLAEDPFFGAVEIGVIKDADVRAKVRSILETSHTDVSFGAQPALLINKLNINSLDEANRLKAVNALKDSVDEASELGAKRMAFLSGKDPGEKDRPRAFDALVKSTREVCAYAKKNNIAIALETFDRAVDKKCLMGPSDYSAKFVKVIREDFPDFGLLYDLSHMPLLSEQPETSLLPLKYYLVHIHVGNCVTEPDAPSYGDLHPRFGWPGGANDVPELAAFLRMLLKIGYLDDSKAVKPWIGFEVKPQTSEETSELVIANTKRVWQDAWAMV